MILDICKKHEFLLRRGITYRKVETGTKCVVCNLNRLFVKICVKHKKVFGDLTCTFLLVNPDECSVCELLKSHSDFI